MKKLTKAMIYGVCGFLIGGILSFIIGYIVFLVLQIRYLRYGGSCGEDTGIGCAVIFGGSTIYAAAICGIIGVFIGLTMISKQYFCISNILKR